MSASGAHAQKIFQVVSSTTIISYHLSSHKKEIIKEENCSLFAPVIRPFFLRIPIVSNAQHAPASLLQVHYRLHNNITYAQVSYSLKFDLLSKVHTREE